MPVAMLQDTRPKYYHEERQEWVGTMSAIECIEETRRLLKYFDIYRDLEDEVDSYAQDEARETNNASRSVPLAWWCE